MRRIRRCKVGNLGIVFIVVSSLSFGPAPALPLQVSW
jgi:hypothetical protein